MTAAEIEVNTLEQCFSLAWDEIKDRKGFLEEQMTVALYYMEALARAYNINQHQGTYRFTESDDDLIIEYKMRLAFTLMHDIVYQGADRRRGRARLEKNVPFGDAHRLFQLVNVNALVGMPSKLVSVMLSGISKTKERLIMDGLGDAMVVNGVWYSQATKLYEEDGEAATTIPQCITNVMGWSKARGILETLEGVEYRGTVDRPRYVPLYEGKVFTGDQRLEINDFEMPWWSFEKLYTLCVNSETGHTYVYLAQINELLAGFCQRQFVKPKMGERFIIQIPYNVIVEPNQKYVLGCPYGHPTYFFV
ncbi:hypothetical protein SPFM15_00039 [Salmonella phage SPFM15]|nr:hypothetical protein SPFM5_00034 [Salmonella phage SPFM5]VFR13663.1 hypothetical protein SPFM15_00039 [Salmonella phage SPFM15]